MAAETRDRREIDRGGGGRPAPSYAHKVTVNGPHKKEKRNVIVSRVKRSQEHENRYFDGELASLLCSKIGVTPCDDTLGYTTHMDKGDLLVEIWLKQHKSAEFYSSDKVIEICPGFTIVGTHPAHSRIISLLIIGLDFNTTDAEISDYVAEFGGKVINVPPEFCKVSSGPWKGQYNGDRRYKVDLSSLRRPMGSYHIIGRRRVKVVYPGNVATCRRCQGTSTTCPGGGLASRCRENGGEEVPLEPHINVILRELRRTPPPLSPVIKNPDATSLPVRDEDFPPIPLQPSNAQSDSQPVQGQLSNSQTPQVAIEPSGEEVKEQENVKEKPSVEEEPSNKEEESSFLEEKESVEFHQSDFLLQFQFQSQFQF